MKLLCPKCKSKLEVDAAIEGCVQCPNCSEELDISALRMATCPICGCGFEESDEIRICSDCKTPHHDECWAENRRIFRSVYIYNAELRIGGAGCRKSG